MTRRFNVQGATLEEAVRRLLAEVAGADQADVKVQLEAPELDLAELADVRLTLVVPEPAQDDEDEEDETDESPAVTLDDLDQEADAAADFVEGILDAMELPGDIQIRVHEDRAEIEVVNVGSGRLIGRRGQTLDAIQELARCALQRRFERRSRVMIDVEGYRARRLEKLLDKAQEAIDDVLDTGEAQRLEPMDVYERKAVHQLVAQHEGVSSSSRGREPTRRVVIERDDPSA
ncbi:MAG TPA: R3H domain-containing nucleic acid-binding protein [Nitriliruptorales bacterium]|nr:R3H domain-containing nucleic acid-binding protein [Nitriliruptorales bacterium]